MCINFDFENDRQPAHPIFPVGARYRARFVRGDWRDTSMPTNRKTSKCYRAICRVAAFSSSLQARKASRGLPAGSSQIPTVLAIQSVSSSPRPALLIIRARAVRFNKPRVRRRIRQSIRKSCYIISQNNLPSYYVR